MASFIDEIVLKAKNFYWGKTVYFVALLLLFGGLFIEIVEINHSIKEDQKSVRIKNGELDLEKSHPNFCKQVRENDNTKRIIIVIFFIFCCFHHFLIFRSIHQIDELQKKTSPSEREINYQSRWINSPSEKFLRVIIVLVMFVVSGELLFIYEKFKSSFHLYDWPVIKFIPASIVLMVLLVIWDGIGILVDRDIAKQQFSFKTRFGVDDPKPFEYIHPRARYVYSDFFSMILWVCLAFWISFGNPSNVIWVGVCCLLIYGAMLIYRFVGIVKDYE